MNGKGIELHKRSRIREHVNALAGGVPATAVLFLYGSGARGLQGLRLPPAKVRDSSRSGGKVNRLFAAHQFSGSRLLVSGLK
ncbi:hypothetical protein GCM10009611_21440 [Arthrobacter roseus]